jgi:hypothetical protein
VGGRAGATNAATGLSEVGSTMQERERRWGADKTFLGTPLGTGTAEDPAQGGRTRVSVPCPLGTWHKQRKSRCGCGEGTWATQLALKDRVIVGAITLEK